MKILIENKHDSDTSQLQGKLFAQNSKVELEVLILGLRKLRDTEIAFDADQKEAISLNLMTLESQLWNRYYRWDQS